MVTVRHNTVLPPGKSCTDKEVMPYGRNEMLSQENISKTWAEDRSRESASTVKAEA